MFGLIWLRIATRGGLLWTLGSSWVAAQLVAPQEGLSSVSEWLSKIAALLLKISEILPLFRNTNLVVTFGLYNFEKSFGLRQNFLKYFQTETWATIFKTVMMSSSTNTHFAVSCFLVPSSCFRALRGPSDWSVLTFLFWFSIRACGTLEYQAFPQAYTISRLFQSVCA
jgi:hypothetical protein